MADETLLDAAAAARVLGISVSQLRRRCYDGTIPYTQIGRRARIRVRASTLLALGASAERIRAATGPEPESQTQKAK
jgi:predicted site-specific integrase-resolvase